MARYFGMKVGLQWKCALSWKLNVTFNYKLKKYTFKKHYYAVNDLSQFFLFWKILNKS